MIHRAGQGFHALEGAIHQRVFRCLGNYYHRESLAPRITCEYLHFRVVSSRPPIPEQNN